MSRTDQVRDLAVPVVAARGFAIYDVEEHGPIIRVTVTGADGADGPGIDDLGAMTKELSRALDEADPISGRYTLEVSSPGLERRLRTPEHWQGAIGETVSIKIRVPGSPAERVRGVILTADPDGVEITLDPVEGSDEAPATEPRRLGYEVIDSARTVFDWEMVAARAEQNRSTDPDATDDSDLDDSASDTRRSTP